MTKAKRPTGSLTWSSRGHALSPSAKAAIIDALGYPADSQDLHLFKCLQRVELWLGSYRGGVEALDNAPSASVYVRELEAVKKAADALMTLLNSPTKGINPFTRATLSLHFEEAISITGPDGIAKVTSATACLAGACQSALRALEPERKSGRGRPKSGAREAVLTKLLELYGDYSKRHYEKRVPKEAFESLSEFERHELAFIRAAFRDIKADTFRDRRGDQKWLELIRPIRQASAKLRMRASQAVEPRHRKKATSSPE